MDGALHNPKFVDDLSNLASASGHTADFSSSTLDKNRRLPGLINYYLDGAVEKQLFFDTNSSTTVASFQVAGRTLDKVFNQDDFFVKLKLRFCSGATSESNNNLLTDEMGGSSKAAAAAAAAAGHNRNGNGRLECLSLVLVIHTLELAEAGTSLCRRRNSHLFSGTVVDDGVWLFFGHLNLTLSSSSMQIDKSSTTQNSIPEGAVGRSEEDTNRTTTKNQSDAPTAANGNETSLSEAARTGNQGPPAPPGRVNDVSWEQFLTQRPGSRLIRKRQILV